jgi:phospholipase A1
MHQASPRLPSALLIGCLLASSPLLRAQTTSALQDCARIDSPTQRLACYDALAERPATPQVSETAALQVPAASQVPAPRGPAAFQTSQDSGLTRLEQYWELQGQAERGTFVLLPYRPNYMLVGSYNFKPDQTPFSSTGFQVKNLETKLQLSFKFKVLDDIAQLPIDIWFGYTQQSYWQLWGQDSSPFRETNYEPVLFASLPVNINLLGLHVRMLTAGFNHQSNGVGGLHSRSWNRFVGGVIFERGQLIGQVRAWYRIPESRTSDDNPDIADYLGHAELSLSWVHGRNTLSATVKNLTRPDNGGTEVGWSFPIGSKTPVKGYLQYYYGYGEALLDYNHRSNRVSLGFLVNDWF